MNDMKLSGGVAIEFDDSDFEADGFVKVAAVARRIAEFLLSKGAPNKFQAERDAWPHVLTGVTLGALHPVDPAKMQVLSVDHCTDGMIRFDELVAWGQTNKLFEFRRRSAETEAVTIREEGKLKLGAGGSAPEDHRTRAIKFARMRASGMTGSDIARVEKISVSRVNDLCRKGKKLRDEEQKASITFSGMLGANGAASSVEGVAARKTKNKSR